jgi:Uri superfamily endonuclease
MFSKEDEGRIKRNTAKEVVWIESIQDKSLEDFTVVLGKALLLTILINAKTLCWNPSNLALFRGFDHSRSKAQEGLTPVNLVNSRRSTIITKHWHHLKNIKPGLFLDLTNNGLLKGLAGIKLSTGKPDWKYPAVSLSIGMLTYKLYSLNNPITNEIRYIGQTTQSLSNRLKKHLRDKSKTHKTNWIVSLKNQQLAPTIHLIQILYSKQECNNAEILLIASTPNLTNSTKGGEGSIGFKHSKESISKMSNIASSRMKEAGRKEFLRAKGLEQWKNIDEKSKTQNRLKQLGRKEIYQFSLDGDMIEKFESARDCERKYPQFKRQLIVPCCKGIYKTGYGFLWSYQPEL